MVHETNQGSGKNKLNDREADHVVPADKEIEEIEILPQSTFDEILEAMSSTCLGQMIIENADRILKVVEETAKWSLPQIEENHAQLQRPLPWVFFLPLIVCLRVFRCWYSVLAIIVRCEPITAGSMVYFFQSTRRHLRAIRIRSLKVIRSREREVESCVTCNTFMGYWTNLFSGTNCNHDRYCISPQDSKNLKAEIATKSPRDEDYNLSVLEMLDKFASEYSDNDSDYVPQEGEDDDDDSSTSCHSINSTTSAEENEEKFSNYQDEVNESKFDLKANNETPNDIGENAGMKDSSIPKPCDAVENECHKNLECEKEEMHMSNKFPEVNGKAEREEMNEVPNPTKADCTAPHSYFIIPKTAAIQLPEPQIVDDNEISTFDQEIEEPEKAQSIPMSEAGSLQDFHSVFQTNQNVAGSSGEVENSTPNFSDEGVDSISPESQSTIQKKNLNHSSHNKHHHYYQYSAKNRSKNRR